MRAVTFQGTGKMEVETVPDPKLITPHDAIIQVTATCIYGSDLHMYNDMQTQSDLKDILYSNPKRFIGMITYLHYQTAAIDCAKSLPGDKSL